MDCAWGGLWEHVYAGGHRDPLLGLTVDFDPTVKPEGGAFSRLSTSIFEISRYLCSIGRARSMDYRVRTGYYDGARIRKPLEYEGRSSAGECVADLRESARRGNGAKHA
jgi:hypothetical protein